MSEDPACLTLYPVVFPHGSSSVRLLTLLLVAVYLISMAAVRLAPHSSVPGLFALAGGMF